MWERLPGGLPTFSVAQQVKIEGIQFVIKAVQIADKEIDNLPNGKAVLQVVDMVASSILVWK